MEGPVPHAHQPLLPFSGTACYSSCSPGTTQVSWLSNPASVYQGSSFLQLQCRKLGSLWATSKQDLVMPSPVRESSVSNHPSGDHSAFYEGSLDTCSSQQSRSAAKPEKCPCRQLSLQLRDLQAPSSAPLCTAHGHLSWHELAAQ